MSAAVLPGVEMITLRWPEELKFENSTYTISRKAKDDLTWTELVSGDTGNDWVDFDVEEGKAYEYEVKRSSPSGTGYVYAGLELALEDADSTIESPGTVILIVDDTQAAALATELDDDGDVGGEAVGRRGSIAARDLTSCSRDGSMRVIFKRTRTPYFSWGTAL